MSDPPGSAVSSLSSPGRFLALLLLCLALFLPGIASLPPTDRDEALYTQATRQMLESGNLLDIRFQEQPRYKKPIGIYWLQALSAGAARQAGIPATAMAPYRLVSLLGATAAVLLLYGLFAPLVGTQQAFLAAVLLAGCLLLAVEATLAKTDATLLATVVAMQGGLARATLGEERLQRGGRALFWGGLGLGMLIKGPVAPLVAALTVVTLMARERSWRRLRQLKPWPWLLLSITLVAPWLITIQLISSGDFLQQSLGGDVLPKLLEGHESHGAPPGTYTLLAPLLLWPTSLVLLPAAWLGWRVRRQAEAAGGTLHFAMAWLGPAWLLFELVPTKLPQYTLPLVPALCLLAAAGMADLPARDRVGRWLTRVVLGVWILGALVLAVAAPLASVWALGRVSLAAAMVTATCLALLFGCTRAGLAPGRQLALCLAAAVLLWMLLLQVLAPSLRPLWPAPQLAAVLAEHGIHDQPVAITGFREPSAVLLLGTATQRTNLDGIGRHLADHGEAIAILPSSALPTLETRFPAGAGRQRLIIGRVQGLNITKGRPLDLSVLQQPCLSGSGRSTGSC